MDSDGRAEHFFDYYDAAISGNVAVVGAAWDNDLGHAAGAVYVYRFDGTSWVEVATLHASDGAADDYFGLLLVVSGDTIMIGAAWDDDNGTDSGPAYVFRHDANGSKECVEEAKLLSSDGGPFDRLGHSIAVSGDVAVMTAIRRG
ncbi:MAG: hypothetical protein D8M59_03940 [Planctomycetes bacterium]|nr:hypothetical protein [Planctomycetota bacterium]NOG55659.1 hypothetical protein [Planctomycetota bacterium]